VAVRIRLKRMGKVRTPFYRIVVCDSRTKRDGRVIEEIGTYNPKTEPSTIHVDSERALHWLSVGAQPSTPVAAILKLTGDWQKHKGEPVEATLKSAEPKRDKTEIFNEALKEAHQEPKAEAVTKKAAKSEKKTDEAKGEGVERADKAHAAAASGEAGSDEATGGQATSDEA
jgi:small subunit ribosomal protein S16